jgi:hypothetical protein
MSASGADINLARKSDTQVISTAQYPRRSSVPDAKTSYPLGKRIRSMAEDARFQGDWNANKGYLQLMINYLALAGEYGIQEDGRGIYKAVRELYKLTKGLIDLNTSRSAKADLNKIRSKLWIKNIDPSTLEGQNLIKNRYEEAWEELEEVEVLLIEAIHKANLVMPRKQQQKGIKQLW